MSDRRGLPAALARGGRSPPIRSRLPRRRVDHQGHRERLRGVLPAAIPSSPHSTSCGACTSERGHRLWDEMIPPPTRKIACRLTTTYAGLEGESTLLETALQSRSEGRADRARVCMSGAGCSCTGPTIALRPGRTQAWLEQMREQHRPAAYLRQIENRWVSSEFQLHRYGLVGPMHRSRLPTASGR